jgi:hypothetical protein
MDHPGPCPVITPLRKVVIDRALGQQILRQHVPLTPAPVPRENGVENFPHVNLPWVPSAWPRLRRRDQRCHDGPLFVRAIRRVFLTRLVFLQHNSALLY